MIAWLAPGLLGLAALAAAPVAIHLLTRSRFRPRPFPALAFLTAGRSGAGAPSRLRHWLVLLLRTLAIVALVLAAAGPRWTTAPAAAGRPLAVVVDGSVSMRQDLAGITAWERATAAADRLIEAATGRPVLVVVAGDAPERSSPRPEPERAPARSLLRIAAPGWGAGSLPTAVAEALAALPEGGELVVISDGSREALAGIDPAAFPPAVAFRHVSVGTAAGNAAVTAIGLDPGLAVVGRPLRLVIEAARHADTPAAGALVVTVRQPGGGEERRTRPVSLPADGVVRIVEDVRPDRVGEVLVEAALAVGGDGLAADDRRCAVVRVVPAPPVAVLTAGDPADPRGPVRPVLAALRAAGLDPQPVPAVPPPPLDGAPGILVTVALGVVPPGRDLAAHLLAGGAWLQVVVSDADAAAAGAVPDLLPPARPGALTALDRVRRGLGTGAVRAEHPLLAGLRGRESLVAQIRARRYRPAPPSEGAQVLVAWADGSALLAARPAGRGQWLMLNASPAEDDTTLAALDALPLLLARVGDVLLPPAVADAAVPSGSMQPGRSARRDDGSASTAVDGAVRLDRPGFWTVDARVVAAAIPAGEADLRPLPGADRPAETPAAVAAATAGTPLWPWLLVAALVVMATEALIAGGTPRRAR